MFKEIVDDGRRTTDDARRTTDDGHCAVTKANIACILGRKRSAGYINMQHIYFIACPRIMKIGQIENRFNLDQLVPYR